MPRTNFLNHLTGVRFFARPGVAGINKVFVRQRGEDRG